MNQKEGGRVGSGTKDRVTRSGDGGGSYRLLKGCAMEHVVCRLYREGGKGGCVCVCGSEVGGDSGVMVDDAITTSTGEEEWRRGQSGS